MDYVEMKIIEGKWEREKCGIYESDTLKRKKIIERKFCEYAFNFFNFAN